MNGGIPFGPTANGKRYISLYIHRGHRPQKSKWCIEPQGEFDTFSSADQGNWNCPRGHYWGVLGNDAQTVGQDGERICKFPSNPNVQIPWHGYPIPILDNGNSAPPDDLVDRWMDQGIVNRAIGNKIKRGNIQPTTMKLARLFVPGRFVDAFVYTGRIAAITEERTLQIFDLDQIVHYVGERDPKISAVATLMPRP